MLKFETDSGLTFGALQMELPVRHVFGRVLQEFPQQVEPANLRSERSLTEVMDSLFYLPNSAVWGTFPQGESGITLELNARFAAVEGQGL